MDSKLDIYLKELISWNNKFNLTSITNPDEIRIKHFEDSMSLSKAYDFSKGSPFVIDVGSGAGFPGIVLKIIFPNIFLTLLESVWKKTDFLKYIVNILNLKNVDVITKRAEDYAKEKREYYDVALCRALANLSVASELCLPFVKVGGIFIAMKSQKSEIEAERSKHAIKILGGEVKSINRVKIGENPEIVRNLIVVYKKEETPAKYPRRAGMPQKRPL